MVRSRYRSFGQPEFVVPEEAHKSR